MRAIVAILNTGDKFWLMLVKGENVDVTVNERTFSVPRHYIALHGLSGCEVEHLGFQEVTT